MVKSRVHWLSYMLGYMTSKGWRISREDANSLKEALPEIPDELIELAILKED